MQRVAKGRSLKDLVESGWRVPEEEVKRIAIEVFIHLWSWNVNFLFHIFLDLIMMHLQCTCYSYPIFLHCWGWIIPLKENMSWKNLLLSSNGLVVVITGPGCVAIPRELAPPCLSQRYQSNWQPPTGFDIVCEFVDVLLSDVFLSVV